MVIGFLAGAWIACFVYWGLNAFGLASGDFGTSLRDAQSLAHHRPPYSDRIGFDSIYYPLTAALFALPFAALPAKLAAGLFAGISAGILTFAVMRNGWNRLLILLSCPFWTAVITVQWTPLLMAAATLPWLFPIIIAKPNLGLPVALRRASQPGFWVGAGIAILLALVSVGWAPAWPAIWWHSMAGFQSFVPVATIAGCLLLLALIRYKDTDSRFLLLMGCIPQRYFYDALLLWLIPATTLELLVTTVASWGAWAFIPPTKTIHQVALLSVIFNYLPMLAVVLSRPWRKGRWR